VTDCVCVTHHHHHQSTSDKNSSNSCLKQHSGYWIVDIFLFTVLNIKWYDFVTNDSVRSQTKLTDLSLIIAERTFTARTCHDVCRLPNKQSNFSLPPDVPAHNVLQHCVNLSQGRCPARDWKRPPGRPWKTWIQQVEEDHGCTMDSLWSSAQDRSLWRSL